MTVVRRKGIIWTEILKHCSIIILGSAVFVLCAGWVAAQTSIPPSKPSGGTESTMSEETSYTPDDDPGFDPTKCKPPAKQKPPIPTSPQEPPECEWTYHVAAHIRLELVVQGPKELRPGETAMICADALDCDFWLEMCTIEKKKWLKNSIGKVFTSLANPADFTYFWESSEPTVLKITSEPTDPCVTVLALPWSGGGGKRKTHPVAISCTVDDAPPDADKADDKPRTKKVEILVRYN